MPTRVLFGFTIMCNFATLLGLWIAYEAAPATLQATIGHVLTISGAITSTLLYFLAAWLVLRPKKHEVMKNETDWSREGTPKEQQLFVCTNGYPLQRTQSGIALNLQILSSV